MENKIVFVAASGSMKENALKIVRQMGLSIPAIISKPGSVLEDVARYPDAEVFISRWSTAQALRSIGKNVVEIRIEFQDLITPLQDLTKAGLKTVAVVTPKGLIANSDKTYEISDTTVLIRSYELIKDADKVVQSLIRDKVEGFIGSQAVIDSAEKWEVPAQFLNCREDSIRHAVEEAQVRVENLLSERRRQSDFLQQIQKFSTELYDSIDQAFRDMKKLDQSSLELASVSKGGADIATKAFEQMENIQTAF